MSDAQPTLFTLTRKLLHKARRCMAHGGLGLPTSIDQDTNRHAHTQSSLDHSSRRLPPHVTLDYVRLTIKTATARNY